MTVPDQVRDNLKDELWKAADEVDWLLLGPTEKTLRYEKWAQDSRIGGVLSHYMDVRHIRQYIKDTLLKKYPQSRHADANRPLRLLGLDPASPVSKAFTRPHGLQLNDGKLVCWGRAADWKTVLLAVHERAFQVRNAVPYGAVLLQASTKFGATETRAVVIDACQKLGIKKLIWHG